MHQPRPFKGQKDLSVADRRVRETGKDEDCDITKLCGLWGNASKVEAIDHIEKGTHTYYVEEAGYRSNVHVRTLGNGKKYLATNADSTSKNNLDNLPDC